MTNALSGHLVGQRRHGGPRAAFGIATVLVCAGLACSSPSIEATEGAGGRGKAAVVRPVAGAKAG